MNCFQVSEFISETFRFLLKLMIVTCRTFLYLCFSLTLAATCVRNALLTNFTIASTVSAISVLLLAGLYVSSFSSCLGAMYGTPRVLQSIASQNVIPGMSCLQRGVIILKYVILICFLDILDNKQRDQIDFILNDEENYNLFISYEIIQFCFI